MNFKSSFLNIYNKRTIESTNASKNGLAHSISEVKHPFKKQLNDKKPSTDKRQSRSNSPTRRNRLGNNQHFQFSEELKSTLTKSGEEKILSLQTDVEPFLSLPTPTTPDRKPRVISFLPTPQSLEKNFTDLVITQHINRAHPIFQIPEILENILRQVDEGSRFNCMLVNRLWSRVSFPILSRTPVFSSVVKVQLFFQLTQRTTLFKVETMTLNKIMQSYPMRKREVDFFFLSDLKALKIHICPQFRLPIHCFSSMKRLEEITITGNKAIDDNYLLKISPFLKNLKHLDLRACDNISDIGIVSIAINCPLLQTINVGRHKNGWKITDISVVALGKYTNVETVGVAGCHITDTGIWEFAKSNGHNIRRLSLNNCELLTDFSVPCLLGFNYFPNISVLEMRNLSKIKDVKFIVKFKLWQKSQGKPLLLETCDRLNALISKEEEDMRKLSCIMSLRDMTSWVNQDDSLTG
ncbi:Amn1p KNAG_0A03920 [Huiozyma naganishii CBS 8797]|uniref:F-box/LRR-repeat protein 15-like leucin rich repeat domain-containing protein n=1 Tax=Huiozyma naganishii (strain ATCC MYA-139 / BCRC 22969 / CBS 8797 / KCTC 17520 / NBRC 10181 / NCYC 3082 / Yp74L-3) TaxID=1071383 RepID=J7S3M9_HUIN7|nr:hypothetical protein KNAG_0A03920 [Kazachstania naganishii CBS 8797]CCK68071.1 hypothetical protein KNAG_0A03920 [Kazachstania naganishii CBS 8797]